MVLFQKQNVICLKNATVVKDHFLDERSRNRRFLVSVKQIMLPVTGGIFSI